jgi:NADH dehydrogenase FAD-containing subunit
MTDDHLRVIGAEDIYALGDCASIQQTRLVEKIMTMFEELDVDHDGTLDAGEFRALIERYQHAFPQLEEWAERSDEMFAAADTSGDGRLQASEFRALLLQVDSTLTRLPSSAQTAIQQGRYLARLLSADASGFDPLATRRGNVSHARRRRLLSIISLTACAAQIDIKHGEYKKDESGHLPFRYKHVGGFEYVGYDNNITARGSAGDNIIDGYGAMWMWRSALLSRGVRPGQLLRAGSERLASLVSGRDCTND